MWQSKDWDNDLKKRTNNPDTSYYPIPELVLYKMPNAQNWHNQNFKLAYRIDIHSAFPNKSERIYIEANTGEIINKIPLESNCSSATVTTVLMEQKLYIQTYIRPILTD